MDKGLQPALCAACDTPIDNGEAYASMGGNIVPYMPAKLYHIRCVPTLKSEPTVDVYDFQLCQDCLIPEPATFVVARQDGLHYYCEEHGTAQDLTRGIPVNPAEHETKCRDCQVPLEAGSVCTDCAGERLGRAVLETDRLMEQNFRDSAYSTGLMDVERPIKPINFFHYAPKRFSVEWFKSHVDHFIISFMVGVPLLIANAVASNIFTHHAAQILYALGVPEKIMHWMGY